MIGTVGPFIKQLESLILQAEKIAITVNLIGNRDKVTSVDINTACWQPQRYYCWGYVNRKYFRANTLADALEEAAKVAGKLDTIDISTLSVKTQKSPVKGAQLKDLCISALFEYFDKTPPSPEELKAKQDAIKKAQKEKQAINQSLRKELSDLLSHENVKQWNKRLSDAQSVQPFKKLELVGKNLSGIKLVDMAECNFSHSNLSNAMVEECKLSKSNFTAVDFENAKFSNIDLSGVNLSAANLSNAAFKAVDFRAANLSAANLSNATFKNCYYDESTQWPDNNVPQGLKWTGKGPDPAALAKLEQRKKSEGPVDMETFMKRLSENIDSSRVKKALSMLKKDSFQLYVDVGENGLTGVVKSQNDPDLVYSCQLNSSGNFCCCTQNLNPCGGLRGAICKHILVLVIGIANAKEMDADSLDSWVQRSLLHQPQLDKDAMGEVLIKYKGADAGEVDWRPTETVPEDFYAF